MLIFHWLYKVFGGSDWGPKAKISIFQWFYQVLGGSGWGPKAKRLMVCKRKNVYSPPAAVGTPGGDPLWLFKNPTRTLQWKPLLGKKKKNWIHTKPSFQEMIKNRFELMSLMPLYSFSRRIRIPSTNLPKTTPKTDFDQFFKKSDFFLSPGGGTGQRPFR